MHQSDLLGEGHAAGDDELHRLFFALLPEPLLRDRISETSSRLQYDHAPGGRPLDPDRYHLTLQFLGDFQQLRKSVFDAAIAAAEGLHPPAFELVLDCAGSFAGPRMS